jgi:hypothetical protein
MKKIPFIALTIGVLFLTFSAGYSVANLRPRPLALVIVDGDEMPGLTDRSRPDTCIAYMPKDNIVHLQYIKK